MEYRKRLAAFAMIAALLAPALVLPAGKEVKVKAPATTVATVKRI